MSESVLPPNLLAEYVLYYPCFLHIWTDFIHALRRLSEVQQVQHARYCKILTVIPSLDEQVRFTVNYDFPGLDELLHSSSYVLNIFSITSLMSL
jgi:hypothetical protein